jgi:hypothetical protein
MVADWCHAYFPWLFHSGTDAEKTAVASKRSFPSYCMLGCFNKDKYWCLYHRPATGIGQVRALTLATRSLNQAYSKKFDVRNILLSDENLQERIENDILILGGPKNNRVAAKFS